MKKDLGKISALEKLGYAGGDTASNLVWMFIVFYGSYFYTDIFKLNPASLALMMVVVRFGIDAVSDPIMGIIADRTTTKWGKFRPYILFIAIPFGLVFWLMLTTPDWGESAKLVYAYITYSLMMIVYTAINIPYSALLGVLSPNTKERTSAASYRFAAAQLGGIIVQACSAYLVVLYGGGEIGAPADEQTGYSYAALTYGVVAVLLFFVTFYTTKERVAPPKNQKTSLKGDFQDLLKNTPWWILFGASIFFIAFVSIRNGSIMYYFKYYSAEKVANFELFGSEFYLELSSLFMMLGTATALIATAFASQLANMLGGKKKAYFVFMALTAVASFFYYIIPPEATGMMFIAQFVISATSGPTGALMFAMYADTADYSALQTGRRATGLVFSAVSFAQKMGYTLAGWLTGTLLAYYGYTANNASADAINGINLLMSILPGVAAAAAAAFVFFYPLTDRRMAEIEVELSKVEIDTTEE